MKKKILIYMTVLACIQVQAQDRWSLRQCIDYAIEHNIDLKQKEQEQESRKVDLHTSKYSWLPALNGSLGQSFQFGRLMPVPDKTGTGDVRRPPSRTRVPVITPPYMSTLAVMVQIYPFPPVFRCLPDSRYPTSMPWPN